MQLSSDRRYRFPVGASALWDAMAATDEFQRWWPWLREFSARGLATGDAWRCAVRPPLPYTVRFTIHLDEVVAPRHVTATVTGDIAGAARFDIEPRDDGVELRLRSELAPTSRAFGVLARLASPIVRRGHDWVLDTGAEQFRAQVDRQARSGRSTA